MKKGDIDYLGLAVASKSARGPFSERGCTDVWCCLIYVLFQAGMCYIGYYAMNNGDPNRVLHPYDPDRKNIFI